MRLIIAQRLTMAHGVCGGMEVQAHGLASGLCQRGHDLLVLTTPHPQGIEHGKEDNIPVRYLSPGSWRRYEPAWWDACYRELAKEHQRNRVDILVSQGEGALGFMARAAGELGIPCAVVMHGTGLSVVRTRIRSAFKAWTPREGYRLVREVMSQAKLLLLWHKVKPMVARWIAVSEQVGKECQQELGLEPRRVVVVPNGIDTHRFRPDTIARQQSRARLGIADDVPLLIATGRLEYEKGFHITIHAFQRIRKRYPKAQLVIAGDGVSRPMLERLAEQTAPGAVHFTGHIPNEDLPALLAAADVYLMPTLRNEGMPMTIIEALAVGLPVIASRVGGVPSTITDGETGLLIPVGHTQSLAQATIRVLEDDQLRLRLAHAARAIAERLYSQTHMVAESERVLLAAIA